MEDLEKHFFSSYKSHLAKEGKEICKEVDSIIGDNDELMVEKTDTYCNFISHSKRHGFDPNLVDKCRKYLYDMSSYRRIKQTLEEVNIVRREKEKWFKHYDAK